MSARATRCARVESTAVGSTAVCSQVPHARELLAEFKASGSHEAFEEIVRRYAGMVYGVCLRTTRNPHDAEDATQAVFLSLAVQCKTGEGVKFVGPWLQQVAKRVSLDIKRSRKRRQNREQRHHGMNGNGNGHTEVEKTGAVDVDDLKRVLGEELSQLPSKYRLPLILHYYGGMTRDEMARELNCKPATLGVRIHRAREMLGRRLHERGAAPPGLVLSGLMSEAIRHCVSDSLVARTVEAACKLGTGQDLGATIASKVITFSRSAAAGAALAAKLKAIAAVILVACLTTLAGGAVAKLVPLQLKLPEILKFNWLPKFRSPLRVPQLNSTQNPAPPAPIQQTDAVAPQPIVVASVTPSGVVPTVRFERAPEVQPNVPAKPEPRVEPLAANQNPDRFAAKPAAQPRPVVPAKSDAPAVAVASASTSTGAASAAADLADASTTVTSDNVKTGKTRSGATFMSIGAGGGGSGFLGLHGANVKFDVQNLVNGAVDQVGGSNTFSHLRIAPGPGSRASYTARGGGALRVERGKPDDEPVAVAGIEVGGKGDGELILGDATSSGNVYAVGQPVPGIAEPSLTVRADAGGSGRVRGWGTVNLPGTLNNNGETIADGYGNGRSLDFDGFKEVINSIENPPVGGTHGWFAHDGARLALPRIHTSKGTGTYTWGDSVGDDTIDLVNSARVTLRSMPDYGYMEIALLALDRGGIPPLPRGHTFIGIWQLDTFAVDRDDETGILISTPITPGGIDLVVRYDDALAAQLGLNENVLKLWKYQDGQWTRVLDDFARNPDLNLLSGHTDGGIGYFAVSAPEPGAGAMLLLAGGGLLARRRRRGL